MSVRGQAVPVRATAVKARAAPRHTSRPAAESPLVTPQPKRNSGDLEKPTPPKTTPKRPSSPLAARVKRKDSLEELREAPWGHLCIVYAN